MTVSKKFDVGLWGDIHMVGIGGPAIDPHRRKFLGAVAASAAAMSFYMVEIEIGVLRSQCLDRRIADRTKLIREIAAWEKQRNAAKARIKWMFTTEKARAKLRKAYPVKES